MRVHSQRWWIIFAALVVILGATASTLLFRMGPGRTRARFDRIELGMNRTQVEAIMGYPDRVIPIPESRRTFGHASSVRSSGNVGLYFDDRPWTRYYVTVVINSENKVVDKALNGEPSGLYPFLSDSWEAIKCVVPKLK